jgi:hypothetical protein
MPFVHSSDKKKGMHGIYKLFDTRFVMLVLFKIIKEQNKTKNLL